MHIRGNIPLRLILFCLIGISSFIIGYFVISAETSAQWIKQGGYWFISLVVFCFLLSLWQWWRIRYPQGSPYTSMGFWKRRDVWGVALLLIGATVMTQVHEERRFKVVMDEPALAGTAYSMHHDRIVQVPTRAYHLLNNFTVLNGYVDKRPLLYPYLLSIFHDLTGYRTENAFHLNTLLTGLLILLVYIFGYHMTRSYAGGLFGVLLLISLPLLHQSATSGGFEILNMVMIVAVMLTARAYIANGSPESLSLLCLSGAMLAYVRYESALYIIPIALVIFYKWYKERQITTPWGLFLTPILLIPYLWHHKIFKCTDDFWQMCDKPGVTSPFSLEFFYTNLGHAINFFFNLEKIVPNSIVISLFGLMGISLFCLYLYKCNKFLIKLSSSQTVLGFFIIGFLINFILLLFFFYGQLDNPIIQRLSLPLHIPIILTSVWLVFSYVKQKKIQKMFYTVAVFGFFTVTLPKTIAHNYSDVYIPSSQIEWIVQQAKSFREGNRQALVISERAMLWAMNEVNSLVSVAAGNRKDALAYYLSQPNSGDIYVEYFLRYDVNSGDYKPTRPLDEDFVLEPVKHKNVGELNRVGLFKVVDIRNAKDLIISASKEPVTEKEYIRFWAKELP